jgi:hypothetical protein
MCYLLLSAFIFTAHTTFWRHLVSSQFNYYLLFFAYKFLNKYAIHSYYNGYIYRILPDYRWINLRCYAMVMAGFPRLWWVFPATPQQW